MTGPSNPEALAGAEFNIGYASADAYESMLPPHYFGGVEDVDLIRKLTHSALGAVPAEPRLRVLDLGCGPGRITGVLAPYARHLLGTDKSAGMITRFQRNFPHADAWQLDTETAIHRLRTEEGAGGYDVVGSFWSMSYPLLECFEETTERGVIPASDPEDGVRRAQAIVDSLVELLAPGGHLLMLFFDAETAEQRLVTRLWERVAPFPGSGRDYTWQLLTQGLQEAEVDGRGILTTQRLPGVAVTSDADAARQWFRVGHLNSYQPLINDPAVTNDVDDFIARHTGEDGRVLLPSGVHLVDFHATTDRRASLPSFWHAP